LKKIHQELIKPASGVFFEVAMKEIMIMIELGGILGKTFGKVHHA
jgi:hypothetical protein